MMKDVMMIKNGIMMKNGQTYLKNLAMFILQDFFKKIFGHLSILYMKGLNANFFCFITQVDI